MDLRDVVEYADQLALGDDEVALPGCDIDLVPAVAFAMEDDEVALSGGGENVVAAAAYPPFPHFSAR